MKSRLFFVVIFSLISFLQIKAQFAGGDGSGQNPYLIETAQQLSDVRNYFSDSQEIHFLLKNDIDLTDWIASNKDESIREKGWAPINRYSNNSSVHNYFDGGGYAIRGLFINRPTESNIGLFGSISNLVISDVHIEDCQITAFSDVGGLCGEYNFSKFVQIKNCSVSGTINSYLNAGLLIGSSATGCKILSCTTSGMIKSIIRPDSEVNTDCKGWYAECDGYFGGVIGYSSGTEISDCYSNAVILSHYDVVGGIAGYSRGPIKNCYAAGLLSGNGKVGGIVGRSDNFAITGCIAAQSSINAKTDIGRIIGNSNDVSLSENYASKDMLVNGEILSGSSGGIQGGNKTLSQLQSKSTYEALGWNLSSIWKIEDGLYLPYLPYQATPARITTELKSKVTLLKGSGGKSASSEVWVKLNNDKPQKAVLNNGSWQITTPALSGNDIITVWSGESEKKRNYSVFYVHYNGDGSEESPFLIGTASELDGIRYNSYYAHYNLTNDIDLKSWIENNNDADIRKYGWIPIGGDDNAINNFFIGGHIDGKNYKIKNLISKDFRNIPSYSCSLFRNIRSSAELTIKNLTIEDCYLVSEEGYAAAFLAETSFSKVNFENCHASGYISGKNAAGFIAASSYSNVQIKDCSVSCTIIGSENAAGLISSASSSITEIHNTHVFSSIKSNSIAAGLIAGYHDDNLTINNSSVSSFIEGKTNAAGLVINASNASGFMISIENCYSSSILRGESVSGIGSATSIHNCYVQGSISGKNAYGITGSANSYDPSLNNVSVLSEIKGIGGSAFRITDDYDSYKRTNINNYALQTMLVNGSIVLGGTADNGHGADISLSKLKTSNFYTSTLNWDFANIWKIDNGASLPYFKTQTAPPVLSTVLSSGTSIIEGTCASGVNQIVIRINDNTPITVSPDGTNWNHALDKPLKTGDAILIYAKKTGLSDSYALAYSLENKNGLGTEDDPILVHNAEELNAIRTNLNAIYQLAGDIDLKQWIDNNPDEDIRTKGWLPIGYQNDRTTTHMSGKLKGKGHTITGLRINRPETDNIGLFGSIYSIDSIRFDNVNITGLDNVGAIAGNAQLVESCHILGNIHGRNNVGGLIGGSIGSTAQLALLNMRDCSFTGYISSNNNAGGIIGLIDIPLRNGFAGGNSYIRNSRSSAFIEGNNNIGGIVGRAIPYTTLSWIIKEGETDTRVFIYDCYSTGVLKGNEYIGGINGDLWGEGTGSSLVNSYSVALIFGKRTVGGISGRVRAGITNSVAVNKLLIEDAATSIARISTTGGYTGNYAYKDMLLNYETVSGSATNMNGLSKTMNDFFKKATYTGLNWDFAKLWTIKENTSLPYYTTQMEPPVLSTAITPDVKTLSGTFDNSKGKTVMIQVNAELPVSANISGNTWSVNLSDNLSVSDVVLIWAEGKDIQRSYAICELVSFEKGLGTEDDPYLIRNAEELNSVRDNLKANYRLANDIDLTEWIKTNGNEDIKAKGWSPIGNKDNSFSGTFSGGNHTIKGLKINRPEQIYVGLFGHISSSKIDSINIVNADVTGADATGILAGGMFRNVTNVNVTGKVSGLNCVGGLVGLIDAGDVNPVQIRWNNFDGEVNGHDFVGGLIGAANHERSLSGPYIVNIRNNTTNGYVNGNDKAGGLIGSVENESSSANRKVTISENYSSTVTRGNNFIGGLVGYATSDERSALEIKDSYVTGIAEGNEYIGGIIGLSYGYATPFLIDITNCYAANYIKGVTRLGGISGFKGNIKTCYAMNPSIVFSSTDPSIGRIVPIAEEASNNFYYENTKVFNNTTPGDYYIVTAYGTSIAKSELMKQDTYLANEWDFTSVWNIWDGHSYPYFSTTKVNEEEPDKTQVSPPELTSDIYEGVQVLSGVYHTSMTKSSNQSDITIWVKINENDAIKATTSSGNWTCTLQKPLKQLDIIKVWGVASKLNDSYASYNIVGDNNTSIDVVSVSLNKTILTLTVGDSETLLATVLPESASNKAVTWASSKPDIVEIDSEGKLKALSPGTTTITVTTKDGEKTATCVVTVQSEPVVLSAFSLNNGEQISIFQTVDLVYTLSGGTPSHFIVSEKQDFSGASWIAYSPTSLTYTFVSDESGAKTVYTKLKNDRGETEMRSDDIYYKPYHPINISSFTLNNGSLKTGSRKITLNHIIESGNPTLYSVSENESEIGKTWISYQSIPIYTLSEGNGLKKIFFAASDGTNTSNIVSSTISLAESSIEMYPNPVKDKLYISIYDSDDTMEVQVYTLNGKLLLSDRFSDSKHSIDLSSCPSGVLIVRVSDGKKTEVRRIIKL